MSSDALKDITDWAIDKIFHSVHISNGELDLFHYTAPENIDKIINSYSLYLTDYRFFDDKKEFIYILKIYNCVLRRLTRHNKIYEVFKIDNLDKKFYFSVIKNDNLWTSYNITNPQIYVACFCKDDKSKYMKKKYAKRHNSKLHFEKLDKNYNYSDKLYGEFGDCIYCKKRQKRILKDIILSIDLEWLQSEDNIKYIKSTLYQILLRYSPYFKHCRYRKEKEQRLIIVQDENNPIYKVEENGKQHISVSFDKLQIELKDYEDGR